MIRNLKIEDARQILHIYQQGLDTGEASFETKAPDWCKWNAKFLAICRLVWVQDQHLLGWAALAPVSNRGCYRGVAEVSVYVESASAGQGIGSELMGELVRQSEDHGIWSLYSSIFPENQATLKLHLKHGFRKIGTRQRIAQLDGVWRDTLILERRSTRIGI